MEIQPDKQTLDATFASTVYFIDFYQRDYKWTKEPVLRLLDDVFYQFEDAYQKNSSLEANTENINSRYPWYYLNTYVTNTVDGRVFVVDGQQRLTTLTLILLKLLSKSREFGSETTGWIMSKIAGYSGTKHKFWMNHARHIQVLKDLMSGEEPSTIATDSGITAVNMVKNYQLISSELDARISDSKQFDTFVHYFLLRLVLINLSVDSTHVPMVFEVINDRGVRLKPYEILKGKFLGQIDKIELDKGGDNGGYNELWEKQVQAVNTFREDEIDNFFRYWLKAKFSNKRKEGQRFDGDYHREIFKADVNALLKLDHNPSKVKAFLDGAFRYYTNLYTKIWEATQKQVDTYPAVFFNSLNELDSQFMMVLSACRVDDPEEDEKIRIVTAELDRVFSLLQLQGAYGSNKFADRLFEISADIREKTASEISTVFEHHLIAELAERRNQEITQPLSYSLFRMMSTDRLNTRFTRYFFGRIELLLAKGMRLNMKHELKDLITLRSAEIGFHIEHILSRNDENLALFGGDEERFDTERNRLGGVLLLKGRDNISSNNEIYSNKLKSYANTLYWNETLREDAYQSKLDFEQFTSENNFKFRHMDQFGPQELEERHWLLFNLLPLMWPVPNCAKESH